MLGKVFIVIEVVVMDEDFMLLEFVQSCMLEFDLRRGSIVRMYVSVCSYDIFIFIIFLRYLFMLGLIRSILCLGCY